MTTAASMGTTNPIHSTTPPIATTVQDGSVSVFPKGWNPATGYGMHPDFFSMPSKMQFNASASQSDPSVVQLNAQGAWNPQ